MKVSSMKSNNIRYKLAWGNLRVLISDTVYENRKMFQNDQILKIFLIMLFLKQNLMIP